MEEDWDLVDSLSSPQLNSRERTSSSRLSLDFSRFDSMPISPLLIPHEETEDLFCESPIPSHDSFYEQQEDISSADIERLCIKDYDENTQEDKENQEEEEEMHFSTNDDHIAIEDQQQEKEEVMHLKSNDNLITIEKDTQANDDDTIDDNNESNSHCCDIYPVDKDEKTHFDFLFTSFVDPIKSTIPEETTRESYADKSASWKNTTTGSSVPFMMPTSPNSPEIHPTSTSFIPPFNFAQQLTPFEEIKIKQNFEVLQHQVNSRPSVETEKKEDERTIKPLKKRIPNLSVQSLSSFASSPKKAPFLTVHQPFSFDISPVDNSPEELEEDPLSVQREIAECFTFAPAHSKSPQTDSHEHGLATLLFELETHCPIASEWYRLTKLNLSRQNLNSIQSLENCFPYLETLQISHNQLKTITGLPSSLIYLYASHNKLSEIDVYKLDRLQCLDVSNNSITAFEDMSCMKSLRKLDASHNAITSCKAFQNLSGLVQLSLKANCLRRLINFESIISDNQLESLDVSFNRIECLEAVENLDHLRDLNASYNDIQYIQLSKPMKRLCKLQLSFNRLKSFDMALFPDLRILYLDDNQIQRIIGIVSTVLLHSFSIRDQGNQPIEYNVQCLRGTQKLYLSGSPFQNIRQMVDFYSLEYLELCSAGLEQLPSDFSKHVPNLSVLNLSMNRLTDIRPLRKLRYLKRLVLIDNCLISLNEVIQVVQYMRQLHYLDLRQNPMSSNIYPPLNTHPLPSLHGKERVSPYISLTQYDEWVMKDADFYDCLSDHWKTRRKVYRALFIQKCPRLIELDQIKIEPTDRIEGDDVINQFRRTQTPHTLSSNGSFSYPH